MGIFLAINSTIDKVLYADLTPAIAIPYQGLTFCDALVGVLMANFSR